MTRPGQRAKAWFDDLGFDPHAPAVAMGTRALGDRPWLIADEHHDTELRLKAQLCDERHDDVFAGGAECTAAALAVGALLIDAGVTLVDTGDLHPLDRAGRSVQEDLCLLDRRADGWHLAAASLCFPSRWRLREKVGRHVTAVHTPVAGYEAQLSTRVDSLFDRLGERPVLRRNWFVHGDDALFQPDRPAREPIVAAADVAAGLVLRSERQTLRRVLPGWILFTIKIQQAPLGALLASEPHSTRFLEYLAHAPPAEVSHRGISPDQRHQIELAAPRPDPPRRRGAAAG